MEPAGTVNHRLIRTVTIKGVDGLHVRAASLIAETVGRFDADVQLVKGEQRANAADVLQLLTLCALEGEQLLLESNGSQAQEAINALVSLFDNGFAVALNEKSEDNDNNHCAPQERSGLDQSPGG